MRFGKKAHVFSMFPIRSTGKKRLAFVNSGAAGWRGVRDFKRVTGVKFPLPFGD